MKFTCDSDEFKTGISVVEKAISSRPSMPILDNIYFELGNEQLCLRGNDLEIGIEQVIPISNVESTGKVLLKAKTISHIVSKMNKQTVCFSAIDGSVNIKSEQADFDLLGLAPDDYPVFPDVQDGVDVQLSVGDIKDLIKHTLSSVSTDDTKQFLNGILMKSEADKIFFIATDGYRLSLKTQNMVPVEQGFSVIAPSKAVSELYKIIQNIEESQPVKMTISERQISFKVGQFLLVSRVIQGQFPDYQQVVPKETQYKFSISRRALLDACDRASIIAASANQVVRLQFEQDKMRLMASATGLGDFKEELNIQRLSGEGNINVAFNVKLILDAIKILDADEVTLSFSSELSPCKLEVVDDEMYLYIIMPIRTSDFQGGDDAPASGN